MTIYTLYLLRLIHTLSARIHACPQYLRKSGQIRLEGEMELIKRLVCACHAAMKIDPRPSLISPLGGAPTYECYCTRERSA